jgi:hypothetical protein
MGNTKDTKKGKEEKARLSSRAGRRFEAPAARRFAAKPH